MTSLSHSKKTWVIFSDNELIMRRYDRRRILVNYIEVSPYLVHICCYFCLLIDLFICLKFLGFEITQKLSLTVQGNKDPGDF